MSRLPAVLLLSLVAHAAVVLGVMAALGSAAPRMLFVDLVEGFGLAAGGGSGGGGASGEPGVPRRQPGSDPAAASPPRSLASHASPSVKPRAAHTTPPAPPRPRASAEPMAPREKRVLPPLPPVSKEEPRPLPDPPGVVLDAPPAAPIPSATAPPTPSASVPAPGASEAASPSGAGASASGSDAGTSAGSASGAGGAGGRERGTRTGQGGSGSGGGLGAGVGAGRGSVVARGVPGDGAAALSDYERYYALLRSRLHAALKYPSAARRRGLSGTVEIEVHVAPSGEIDRAEVVASSTHRLLDEAALDAARGLRVPFPPGLPPAMLRMRLPVVFDLRDQP